MRKNTSFAIAATMLGLVMIFWAKSSVEATGADVARPKIGMVAYEVLPSSYLPISGGRADLVIGVRACGRPPLRRRNTQAARRLDDGAHERLCREIPAAPSRACA